MTSVLLRTAAKRAANASSSRREICRSMSSMARANTSSLSATNQRTISSISSTCHALTPRPIAAVAGVPAVRTFAAAATADASSSSSTNSKESDNSKDQKDQKKKKSAADEPNIFLDNIGKIFLGAIGAIILALVRSSKATSNRTALRDYIENHSLLDPLEIDDLRVANSELTVEVYEKIMADVYAAFPSGRASYEDFVSVVMTTMRGLKGEAFTIQLGHLIDRVAIAAIEKEAELEKQNEDAIGGSASDASELGSDPIKRQLPLPLLFTVLSLALQSDVTNRVRLLFSALQKDSASAEEGMVTEADIIRMVSYLQTTCQLVPDAQIVQTETKYPVQTYREGSPAELVGCAKKLMEDDGLLRDETKDAGRYDISDFHRILRTKQICAWGECYRKTKNLE